MCLIVVGSGPQQKPCMGTAAQAVQDGDSEVEEVMGLIEQPDIIIDIRADKCASIIITFHDMP